MKFRDDAKLDTSQVDDRRKVGHAVEPGWIDSTVIEPVGAFRVLFYADGSARFEHSASATRPRAHDRPAEPVDDHAVDLVPRLRDARVHRARPVATGVVFGSRLRASGGSDTGPSRAPVQRLRCGSTVAFGGTT